MKDQTKKVASLKHKEQVEKSRNARLMEEARKREDNMSETSQQVKVTVVCGLYEFCRNYLLFSTTMLIGLHLRNLDFISFFSCFEGHSASEDRAYRRARGGPERERSDHCWARDGACTGGGCQVTAGETGTQTHLNTHDHDRAILIQLQDHTNRVSKLGLHLTIIYLPIYLFIYLWRFFYRFFSSISRLI